MRFLLFAATRYWTDRAALEKTFAAMRAALAECSGDVTLVVDGDLTAVPERLEAAVIVPLSGAVQRPILAAAARCGAVTLYAGYCAGNFAPEIVDQLLYFNAAPTLMDTWAVLRRTHKNALLAVTKEELADTLRAHSACAAMRGAKLVRIGETEPWVISNAAAPEVYEQRLCVTIERVAPEEIIGLYERTTAQEARFMLRHYADHAERMIESTQEDLVNACRFGTALMRLLDAHGACGGAIACFDLIRRTGTNACLGVAYLNDRTDKFMACEGDLDSAVTMLLLRGLTGDKLWMANPCLDASGKVNFSHCTAPWHVGGRDCPYVMRRHHESGAGVSLQVTLPQDRPLTLCRISDECRAMTVHTARAAAGERKPVCRTQLWAELDDYAHYLRTALGCHQVIAFENIEARLRVAARLLGLTVL